MDLVLYKCFVFYFNFLVFNGRPLWRCMAHALWPVASQLMNKIETSGTTVRGLAVSWISTWYLKITQALIWKVLNWLKLVQTWICLSSDSVPNKTLSTIAWDNWNIIGKFQKTIRLMWLLFYRSDSPMVVQLLEWDRLRWILNRSHVNSSLFCSLFITKTESNSNPLSVWTIH